MIKLITLNVSGLRRKKKRDTVFNWLKRMKCDIAVLQEVYCCENDLEEWGNEWGGRIFGNHGSNRSKGVLTLINQKCDITKTEQLFKDNEGRLLAVKIEMNDEIINVWNAYAPNNIQDRKNFLEFLKQTILKYGINGHNLLGGDFNTVLDPKIDMIGKGGLSHFRPESANKIKELLKSLDLLDIWRKNNGNKKRFTWSRKSTQVKSTLDYWFIPNILEDNVERIEIIPGYGSDHMAIEMKLDLHKDEKGCGYWKLNNSLLENSEYNDGIKMLIAKVISEYGDMLNKRQFWDLCKNKIRKYSIDFSKGSTKENNLQLKVLEENLKKVYDKIVTELNNTEYLQEYEKTKLEYELLYHHHMQGLIIRSKAQWSQEGEKCTKYFMNLEKRNVNKKVITSLLNSEGVNVTNDDDLIKMQVDYYENLYKTKSITRIEDVNEFMKNINVPKLSEENRMKCEGMIDNEECLTALKKMSNNKSPGCDGLTAEFYKVHWQSVGTMIVDSFNEAYEKGELSSSHKRGIITLLHKGKLLPRNKLDNWRPITLLNIDYKIAAKALASRISEVLPTIINTDQNGFLKKRGANLNIRLIEDILRYTEKNNIKGAMICIDFKKAFDTIKRDFILYSLKLFNFGEKITNWIKTMFNNTVSCVLHNGHMSSFFAQRNGLRQGCNLSPLLYVVAAEVMANQIRQSEYIHGIELPFLEYDKNEVKITQFADDTTVFVKDEESITNVLKTFELFSQISGLYINKSKSDAVWIGAYRESTNEIGGINWKCVPNNNVKILGVVVNPCTKIEELCVNWEPKMELIERSIRAWTMRNLTMVGKVLIVKSLLASQLSFIGSIIDLPSEFVNRLNRMFFKFVWGGSEKVKRTTLINEYEKGGLKMLNLSHFLDSLKLTWIKKLADSEISTWKNIPISLLKNTCLDLNIFKCNCSFETMNKSVKGILKEIPSFYLNLVKVWLKTNKTETINDIENWDNQVIWNNDCITSKGNTLYFKGWINIGFIYVSDLFKDDGKMYTFDEIKDRFVHPANACIQYIAVKQAIPTLWKNKRTGTRSDGITFKYKNGNTSLELCTTKIYRKEMIDKVNTKPICELFWERKFEYKCFEWGEIWGNHIKQIKEPRLMTLNWKIISNIYPTKIFLHKIGKEQDTICDVCNEIDYIEHFFYYCKKIKSVWTEVNNIVSQQHNSLIRLSVTDVLFGYDIKDDDTNNSINKIISVGKLVISKFRYGNHPHLISLLLSELQFRDL